MKRSYRSVSPPRLEVSDSLILEALEQGLFTHAAYGLAVHGAVVAQRAFGLATADTVFDLASLTKPMATATCALQLVERGKLHLRQSVAEFFETDFGPLPHLHGIEIRHLLTHTSGLPPIPSEADAASVDGASINSAKADGALADSGPADGSLPDSTSPDRSAVLGRVLTTQPLRPPGAAYTYSDTGYILLGEIVARVWGTGLDAAFDEGVARPLNLTQTRFLPCSDPPSPIAPTQLSASPGIVHDPRAREMGGVAGHAGLFGTVPDVLTYAEAIRSGGAPILSPASAARMSASQIDPTVGGQSYGWFCAGNALLPRGDLFSDWSFGHSGFTGTLILIDPACDLALVLLTNRVVNEAEDNTRFLSFRRRWLNTVAAAVE